MKEGKTRKGGLNKKPSRGRPPLPAMSIKTKRFQTEMEKKLWKMLYKSQMALAIMCLDESNRTREEENTWPCGMQWPDMVASSHATFCRIAREKSGIDHETYLEILRENEDAIDISDPICKKLFETGEM